MAQSTPLVTIPQAPPGVGGMAGTQSKGNHITTGGATTTTTAVHGSDHPLAAVPSIATTVPPAQPPLPPQSSSFGSHYASQQTPISLTLPPAPPPIGPSAVAVPKQLVSMPSLSQQHLNADELADLFLTGETSNTTTLGDNNSGGVQPLLRPLPLPETQSDLERMRVLVERRAWGDVLSITASLLKGPSSHYAAIYTMFLNKGGTKSKIPPSLLQSQQLNEFMEILILQGHAWIQMRRYKELGAEVQEWSYCHYNNRTDNREESEANKAAASWIPWNIHIFAATALQFTMSDKSATTSALWQIRHDLEKDMSANVMHVIHVDQTLSNLFCAQGEWRMALESLERLMELVPQGAARWFEGHGGQSNSTDPQVLKILTDACQCELLSRQGRILLQIGAVDGARILFERATMRWQDIPSNDVFLDILKKYGETKRILEQAEPQLQANLGLLQFAHQDYNAALEHFRKSLQIMETMDQQASTNSGETKSKYITTDWVGGGLIAPVSRHSLYSEVTSNLAVTALYTVSPSFLVHPILMAFTSDLKFTLVSFTRSCSCHGTINTTKSVGVVDGT